MFAALLLTVCGALALRAVTRDDTPVTPARVTEGPFAAALADALDAVAPFAGMTEATITVDGEDVRVVVADEPAERRQGLRERDSLGPYDAMLFVFPEDTDGPFTMSRVPVDLDIRWLDEDGVVVAEQRMTACPDRDDGSCPRYEPGTAYRFALETIAPG